MYAFELGRALARAPDTHGLDLTFLVGRNERMRVTDAPLETLDRLYDDAAQRAVPYQLSKEFFGRVAIARSGVDLYHATDPMGTPRIGLSRVVVTCHDLIPAILGKPYLGLKPRWVRIAADYTRYHRPDHVIAISDATRADLVRLLALPRERISVVHHGIDEKAFSARGEPGERERVSSIVGSARPFFLYVGAFDHRKGIGPLIEAFGRVVKELDEDVVLVGKIEDKRRSAFEEMIRRAGVEGRVRFVGFARREDLPALYRTATAHVFPSEYEGFGMTLVEAMASGCPVIAHPVSAMPEVCGDAAEWAPPHDVDALARALSNVAKSKERRRELSERGVERARQFNWDRAASETLAVYRSVLDRTA